MFKKIQNYLLINNPLLWNLKIVPLLAFLIAFQLLFFSIGFINGALDFNEFENNYRVDYDGVIIFFSVLVSIITLILWIVFYFKNNAFKSYYPKTNFSLFKEWILLLLVSFLLCSPIFIYYYGKDVRVRSYYSEMEAKKRCNILNIGSLFIGENFQQPVYVEKIVNDSMTSVPLDYVQFNNKKYSLNSIFNKEIEGFSFSYQNQDSITKIKVKNWLQNNKKDSVRLVLNNYLKIAHEHQLKSNIDTNKWLSIVYNYPNFESSKIVGELEKEYYSGSQYPYGRDNEVVATIDNDKLDTINQYLVKEGKETYVYNKTYVPAKALNYNYQKIAEAFTNPNVKLNTIAITFYFAIGLSLLLFSFRTSTGRNWLIALISMGIINIIIGIISVVFSSEYTYLTAILILTLILFAYFTIVLKRKKSKGISGITLNGLLWLTPTFIPIVYHLILELAKKISGYRDYNYYENNNLIPIDVAFPKITLMKEFEISILYLNIVFVILIMIFYSFKIKKWKGIAEN